MTVLMVAMPLFEIRINIQSMSAEKGRAQNQVSCCMYLHKNDLELGKKYTYVCIIQNHLIARKIPSWSRILAADTIIIESK